MDDINKKEVGLRAEIALLNQRLDSQSKRIAKLQDKLSAVLSNQKHYLKVRLPDVLKREKARTRFTHELDRARAILKGFGKENFTTTSNSKNKEKRDARYVGMFTHVEIIRLRRLLDTDHSSDYILYRQDNCKKLKGKHILFFDDRERLKLRYLLKKRAIVPAEITETKEEKPA